MLFSFFVFEWKYPFWANLVQKVKVISWIWNLVARLIRICRIQWYCSLFFVFQWKYPFWTNFVQKIKIVTWSWKLVPTLIRICRIQWWCSFFFCFWWEILFSGKFSPKSQNYQSKLKFGACTNSNMLNSIVMFTFFVYDWKYPFWGNLVQKIKIISLRWNWFYGHRHFFCFSLEIPFLGKFGPKSQTYMFKLTFGT